jgi:hypothetical protein
MFLALVSKYDTMVDDGFFYGVDVLLGSFLDPRIK